MHKMGGEGSFLTPRPSFSTRWDYLETSLLVLVRFLISLIINSSHTASPSIFAWAPAVKPVTPAAEPAGLIPPEKVPLALVHALPPAAGVIKKPAAFSPP